MLVHLGAPAGGAVGAWPSFGPRVGHDATEGPTAVGSTADALHHVTRDAVLVISHLPLRTPTPQTEVEDGGDLTASPSPRGEGASEERVEGLDENVENRLRTEVLMSYCENTSRSFFTYLPPIHHVHLQQLFL